MSEVVPARSSAAPRRATSRHGGRRVRHVLGVVASWLGGLIAAAVVALALALTVVPAVAGGHTLTVLSGSMVPALPVGSVVVDRPQPADSLRVGDIVTYSTTAPTSGKAELVTHRIVAIDTSHGSPVFTTRGDANNVADARPVAADQVRGKVWYHVPYIGTARNVLLTKGTALIAGAAVLFIAGIWILRRVWRPKSTAANTGERGRS